MENNEPTIPDLEIAENNNPTIVQLPNLPDGTTGAVLEVTEGGRSNPHVAWPIASGSLRRDPGLCP